MDTVVKGAGPARGRVYAQFKSCVALLGTAIAHADARSIGFRMSRSRSALAKECHRWRASRRIFIRSSFACRRTLPNYSLASGVQRGVTASSEVSALRMLEVVMLVETFLPPGSPPGAGHATAEKLCWHSSGIGKLKHLIRRAFRLVQYESLLFGIDKLPEKPDALGWQ